MTELESNWFIKEALDNKDKQGCDMRLHGMVILACGRVLLPGFPDQGSSLREL